MIYYLLQWMQIYKNQYQELTLAFYIQYLIKERMQKVMVIRIHQQKLIGALMLYNYFNSIKVP